MEFHMRGIIYSFDGASLSDCSIPAEMFEDSISQVDRFLAKPFRILK